MTKKNPFFNGTGIREGKIPLNMFTYIIYRLVVLHNLLSVRLWAHIKKVFNMLIHENSYADRKFALLTAWIQLLRHY